MVEIVTLPLSVVSETITFGASTINPLALSRPIPPGVQVELKFTELAAPVVQFGMVCHNPDYDPAAKSTAWFRIWMNFEIHFSGAGYGGTGHVPLVSAS